MNKKIAIGCVAFLSLYASASSILISDFKQCEGVEVRTPFMSDTIAPDGSKYDLSSLLKTPLRVNFDNGVEAKADTSGVVMLARPAQNATIHMLQTQLRAERFLKGVLNVTSTSRFEVMQDGKTIHTKSTVEDSIAPQSTAKINMRLEPQADAVITIKVLTKSAEKAEPSIKVEFTPDEGFENIALYSDGEMLRRFAMRDIEYGEKAVSVQLSPDANYLITKYRNKYSADRTRTYAVLTDVKTGKVINSNLNFSAQWMPKSNKIYYMRQVANGVDIVTLDPKTGREEVLMASVPEEEYIWSPNEDYMLYYHTDEGVKESSAMRRYENPDDRIPGNRTRVFIMKYNPATGLSERLTFGNHSTVVSDISPDGRYIAYFTYRDTPTKRPFSAVSLYQMDLQTLAVDTLAFEPGLISSATYSPDGKKLFLMGSAAAFNNLGKNCGDHPIPNDFDNQGYIMDIATKEVKPVTLNFDPAMASTPQWNKGDGLVYFTAEDGFYQRLYSYDPVKVQFKTLPLNVDYVTDYTVSQSNGGSVVYIGQGYDHAGVVYMLDVKKGKNTLVSDTFKPTLDEIDLAKTETWKFTASDGSVIDGIICYPPNFDETKKYPLIVYYYGGTSPSERSISHPYTPQMFASRDYVVYVLNPSGTTGYGQEFSARHVNAWGKRTADEIIEGVKQFVAEHPFVNGDKIGCLGASYGGFMTQYLQTKTDIFAAAVSHAGISNVTSYWGEGFWGYSYNGVAAADSYPWTNPELFTEQGSLFNADKIDTPLLLLHGTSDTNVPVGESIQIYNALKILGKDVELITMDGEDHVIRSYEKRVPWHNTIMAWFAKWLQDDSKWWDDLYPKRHL